MTRFRTYELLLHVHVNALLVTEAVVQGVRVDSLAVRHALANVDQELLWLQILLSVLRASAALFHRLILGHLIIETAICSAFIQVCRHGLKDTFPQRECLSATFHMEEVPCGKLHAESPFLVESHAALHVETRVPTHRTLAR